MHAYIGRLYFKERKYLVLDIAKSKDYDHPTIIYLIPNK